MESKIELVTTTLLDYKVNGNTVECFTNKRIFVEPIQN